MAEQLTKRVVEGNIQDIEIDPTVRAAAQASVAKTPLIDIQDVLDGKTTSIGDIPVRQSLVELANKNDVKAISALEQQVATYNRKIKAAESQAVIPLTKRDASGELVVDIPANLSDKPALLGIGDSPKEQATEFAEAQIRLNDAIKSQIVDPQVQEILGDYFKNGFFPQLQRDTENLAKGVVKFPNTLKVYAEYATRATVDAIANGTSFSDEWPKYSQTAADELADYRRRINNAGYFSATYASGVNEYVKDKYIERYGLDAFQEKYQPLVGTEGDRLNIPIIPEDMGQVLIDYGFNELPFLEQFASFFVPNAAVTGVFTSRHISKGTRQLNMIAERGKNDPTLLKMNPVDAIRRIEIADKKNQFTKAIRTFQASVGSKFGYRGAVGNVTETQQHRRRLKKLSGQIEAYEEVTSTAVVPAGKSAKDVTVNIPDGTEAGVTMSLADANARLGNLNNRYTALRRGTMYTDNPFIAEVLSDEVLITAGQTAGYNLLPSLFSDEIDGATGGMFGALATAIGGRPTLSLTKGTLQMLGGATKLSPFVSTFGRFIEDIRLAPRSFFVDRSFDDVSDAIGRQLTPDEVRSFREASKLMANLTVEGREAVFQGLQRYNEIRNRIVNAFPEGKPREEALEAFTVTFGHASGLAPLQVIEKSSIKKLKPNLKGLTEAVDAQLQSQNTLEMARLGIGNLRRMIRETTGVDTQDRDYIEMLVNGFEAAADGQIMLLGQRQREYLKLLEEYKSKVLQDPSSEIAGDILPRLTEMEIKLTPGAINDVEKQREILLKNTLELDKALQERIKGVDMLRGTAEHKLASGRLTEVMANVRDQKIRTLGKAAYTKANEAMGGRVVDLSPLMDTLLEKLDFTTEDAIRSFFSADSEFFRSRTGKFAFKALEESAERSIRNSLDNDQEAFEELMVLVKTPTKIKSDGSVVDNEDFIGEDPSFSEIAILLNKRQTDEGEKFIPFPTTPFEADELRRHFYAKGRSLKQKDPTAANPFNDAGKAVDESIGKIKEIEQPLKAARKEYKRLKFDPSQSKGSLGARIAAAQAKPDVEEVTPNGYMKRFNANELPHTWHDPIAEAAGMAISRGNANDQLAFKTQMDEFGRVWADSVEEINGDKVFVYDLTLPNNSEENFANIGGMLQNNVFNMWGDQVRSQTLDKIKLGSLGTATQSPVGGNYNFSRIENINNMSDSLTVYVRKADGSLEERQWFSMEKLIAEENDIVKLLQQDQAVRDQYAEFVRVVNGDVGDIRDEAVQRVNLDTRGAKKLSEAANITDPAQFYNKYIENFNEGMFETLKENFIRGYTSDNVDVSIEDATDVFNQGVLYMVTNGLLKRAEVAKDTRVTFRAMDGSERAIETMSNAAQMAQDLSDENTLKILRQVMDKDHIQFMQDMADMMTIAAGVGLQGFTTGKGIRGISPNEMISRAFNIARGMVSPTYVGAEFAFRILEENKVSAFEIAAGSKEGTRIMSLLLKDPELLTPADVRTFSTIVTSALTRELVKREERAPDFVPSSAIDAAYQRQTTISSEDDQQSVEGN